MDSLQAHCPAGFRNKHYAYTETSIDLCPYRRVAGNSRHTTARYSELTVHQIQRQCRALQSLYYCMLLRTELAPSVLWLSNVDNMHGWIDIMAGQAAGLPTAMHGERRRKCPQSSSGPQSNRTPLRREETSNQIVLRNI